MNRRELLLGVAATPIAWALQQYARTHTGISFSGWLPVAGNDLTVGPYYHLVCDGDQWFINGKLQS